MKKYIIVFSAIILAAVIAFSCSNGKTETTGTAQTSRILSVNDIQTDPYAYKGTITITGVVAKFSEQDPKVFAMVDASEAKHCRQTGCARFYLFVRYEGNIPKEWDEVNVTGTFVEGGKLLFAATKVDVLRHLTLK
jgi:hypothetical protein